MSIFGFRYLNRHKELTMPTTKRPVVIVTDKQGNVSVGVRIKDVDDSGIRVSDDTEEVVGEVDYDPDNGYDVNTAINVAFLDQVKKVKRLQQSVMDLLEANKWRENKTAELGRRLDELKNRLDAFDASRC